MEVGDVWKLFLAVGVHDVAIVFCIGVDMVANNTKKLQILTYMTVLSLVASFGIVIGILVTEHSEANDGVRQSLRVVVHAPVVLTVISEC